MKLFAAVAAIATMLRVANGQATVIGEVTPTPTGVGITPATWASEATGAYTPLPAPTAQPTPSGWNDGTYSYLPNSAAQLSTYSIFTSGGGVGSVPVAIPTAAAVASTAGTSSKHHTLTIALAVVLPIVGAIVLLGILLKVRARRAKNKERHAWVMRPGGWTEDQKRREAGADIEQPAPPSPPAPSHQRVRSV
ncbi:hypothetical protein BOTBODRAFT_28386, partial [Botryobasidium botryosum FD-172 SS1]